MKAYKVIFLLPAILLYSCDLQYTATSRQNVLSNIRLCDRSYVGLLGFLHVEETLENRNNIPVCEVELKAWLFNKETKQHYYEIIKLPGSVCERCSLMYSQKLFVGFHLRLEHVELLNLRY